MNLLDRTGLAQRANVLAASLTLLERKRLELARALATGPRVLLLDEIGGGLTEAEVAELVQTIRDLRAQGITIVWIEHIVHALLSVVDRLLAIDFGRMLKEGKPDEVMASPEVQAVYLGIGTE
jgi:branched-chain amino acid transport system ATP-binding protein